VLSPLAAQGRALAQESCSGCHAIDKAIASPNSNAPLFPVIVNQEGVSSETLSYWLRGAHNYPSEMDFYLDAQKVDALVAYMLTLQDPNYERPID
jgi:mono/diheme cytochrome c family protein